MPYSAAHSHPPRPAFAMWLALALAAALGTTASDVLTKRAGSAVPKHVLALARWVYAMPVLALCLPGLEIPRLSTGFWATVLVIAPMEVAAVLLYVRALSTSPLSLCVPFLSFTPALVVVTGALALDEMLPPAGLAGVLAVAVGSYVISLGEARRGFLEPFLAIVRHRGPRLILAVAAIYAVTSALGKRAVLEAGPRFFAIFYTTLLAAILLPLLIARRRPLGAVATNWRRLLPIGLLLGAVSIVQFTAYTMAPVAYVIAVKRTSMVMGVVAGRVFFGEGKFAERILGSLLMLGGVALIALAGM